MQFQYNDTLPGEQDSGELEMTVSNAPPLSGGTLSAAFAAC